MNEQLASCVERAGLSEKFQGSEPNQTFAEIGVDSLDLYALVLEIQEEVGTEIQDEELEGVQLVVDLERFFRN